MKKGAQLLKSLTERELEVLSLVANGFTSNKIGKKLKISSETVKVHRRNMLKKVRAHNTFELMRLALKRKWI
ncbi:MAG: response regulator transcription factor [Bacteroidia bacterium]|nr:response regulator transcription factor [Bacteroidia bacterium]